MSIDKGSESRPTPRGVESRPTAGLRGASWNPALLPEGLKTTVHPLQTPDGAQVVGYLHSRGGEKVVVVIMHPRELLVTHYLVPAIVSAGFACWTQGTRTTGNDLRLEHEIALIDVATGMNELYRLGFAKVIQLGNSGGAGLFSFYNQQATREPSSRILKTPGGRPTKLDQVTMPAPDGFIFVAPHPGQGRLLMNCIDPSVTNETDPMSIDEHLYPFRESNGFRRKPESSKYATGFVTRYREAQKARVARIDAFAKVQIAERMAAKGRNKTAPNPADAMRGALNEIFFVWRTDADLRCFDLDSDPSDRRWGTVWGADPMASNLGSVGFGRICTPESWLSTWSGLSSNASFEAAGPSMQQPVLMIYYTGDNTVFPSDVTTLFNSIATSDKQRHDIRGNHHGHPLAPGEPVGQHIAGDLVSTWLKERFS